MAEACTRLRAVEGGFNYSRCSSYGVSGIYDPLLRTTVRSHTGGDGDGFIVRVPMRLRLWNLVGATRRLPGNLALVNLLAILAFVLLRGCVRVVLVGQWSSSLSHRHSDCDPGQDGR